MKRWQELPDVPGWTIDLKLPTFAVYRRVFDEAVVLVSLGNTPMGLSTVDWYVSGCVGFSKYGTHRLHSNGGDCPFAWAEERFGKKE